MSSFSSFWEVGARRLSPADPSRFSGRGQSRSEVDPEIDDARQSATSGSPDGGEAYSSSADGHDRKPTPDIILLDEAALMWYQVLATVKDQGTEIR
jgi:hypothetical protein